MTGKNPDLVKPWRGIALILATFALALKLMIPTGFMVSSTAGEFQLVLCTVQGVQVVDPGLADRHVPDQAPIGHDAPCAFAGHGAFLNAPSLIALGSAAFAGYAGPPVVTHASLAPGRGLAAPPPPARGPPRLLV